MLKCDQCFSTFLHDQELKDHVQTHHLEVKIELDVDQDILDTFDYNNEKNILEEEKTIIAQSTSYNMKNKDQKSPFCCNACPSCHLQMTAEGPKLHCPELHPNCRTCKFR